MLTEQAIQEFMTSRGGLRIKTQREYLKHLNLFKKSFSELPDKPQPIQLWLNSIRRQEERHELAPETIHARFRTVRALYNQVHLWHPDIPNPISLVRPPRLQHKVMRTFTEEQLYRIFTLPLSPRDRTMVTLLLDTGIRAQECANLTWDNVQPDCIIVTGKTGERAVPITEITLRLLRSLKAQSNHNHYVFQGERGSLTYEGIYKTIRHICHLAGIEGKRSSPHTFRHTFGTQYAASGACDPKVLQDIMGHRDFKTTLRYIHSNRKHIIENHQLCTPLRLIAAAAQGSFFDKEQAIKEAETIIAKAKRIQVELD